MTAAPGRTTRSPKRKAEIEAAGLTWSVVESIIVHEDIKTRTGRFRELIENYKASIRAVAAAGIRTVCYNFMAITDWTRTDLDYPMPHGGTALRFDIVDFCAYDVLVLKRHGAEDDHPAERIAAARKRLAAMSESDLARLEQNLIGWVPAREFIYDRDSFRRALDVYRDLSVDGLRENLFAFLREIVPAAEEAGVRMAIHPDDPPFPIFGLPRVVSSAADARALLDGLPLAIERADPVHRLLWRGSRQNDLVAMAEEFASDIHFAHLRNVTKEPDGSFHEAEHLDGDTDMVRVVAALMAEERRRKAEGRSRLGNPDAARPRPRHRRRHRQEGESRLFLHRPPEGARGTARHHAHHRHVRVYEHGKDAHCHHRPWHGVSAACQKPRATSATASRWRRPSARSLQRARRLRRPAAFPSTRQLEAIFADPSIDAVLLLTPPNTHLELVQRAAAAGKHILLEKPLEISLERAEALVAAAEAGRSQARRRLAAPLPTGQQGTRRHHAEGRLGAIVSASARLSNWRPQSYYDQPGRGTKARDGGGVLLTQAIHTLDLLDLACRLARRGHRLCDDEPGPSHGNRGLGDGRDPLRATARSAPSAPPRAPIPAFPTPSTSSAPKGMAPLARNRAFGAIP